jgi:5'-nucleotidase
LAHEIVARYVREPLREPVLLNVNIPGGAGTVIQGMLATRLGKRHKAEPALKASDPHGEPVYWVGKVGAAADDGPGTDFHATAGGYVSITPLQIDLTRFEQIDRVGAWLEK